MDTKIDFLYLSEPDMIKAGVKDMSKCVDCMEDLLVTLNKGDYMMGGENHNSHGCMIMFPDDPKFPGMPKNGPDRRFMAMPAYLGGKHQLAGMKWYGSNIENKEKGLPRSILMMMLNDKDTGAPLALMSANLLSSYRTGGIPGVGAKYLARKDSKPLLWFVWRGSFAENSHSCKKNDIFIQQIVKKFKPSRQTNHEPRQTT